MMILFIALHVLAAIIWVGGMYFAHQMVRPAVGPLEVPVRLALWRRIFARFFPLVWGLIAVLLISGIGMQVMGVNGPHVMVMETIGGVMILAFAHLFFAPWKQFRRAVDGGDFPEAARQIEQIRRIITLNLGLGLLVAVLGATGRYWS